MASSPQPGRRARHQASNRSSIILADLSAMLRPHIARGLSRPGPTVAKASALMAAGSLVLALVVPSEPASASAEVSAAGALTADAGVSAGAGAMSLARERTEQQASRSVARTAAAVSAPTVAAPATSPSFGAMSFKAEEKPPPPPPPPPPAAKSSGGSSGSAARSNRSSGSSGSSSSGRGSGYDWNAANSCSCARGLTQNSMRVLAAVKYSFPNMSSIGGVRPDSIADHPSGRALDFMTTNKGYGDSIANMLISRSGELNIEYIIWYQRIWFPGKGWRQMENRGGTTANHMDHVHVTVR